MVNMENALHDTVILTDSEGVAKIRLGDHLKNNFSFDVNIQNLSNQDVTFTQASLVLQTDGYETDESRNAVIINNKLATLLNSSADVNSLLHVSAGESRTETISVKLDSSQMAELEQIFTNGFFVEGYLLLSDAENCCSVSIPLLGFNRKRIRYASYDKIRKPWNSERLFSCQSCGNCRQRYGEYHQQSEKCRRFFILV